MAFIAGLQNHKEIQALNSNKKTQTNYKTKSINHTDSIYQNIKTKFLITIQAFKIKTQKQV